MPFFSFSLSSIQIFHFSQILSMAHDGIRTLIGAWDYVSDVDRFERNPSLLQVDGDNFDEFMKELGVGMMMRMAAKGVKPRLVIAANGEKWSIRSESTFKTVGYDFTPGVEFNETTPDGRELVVSYSSAMRTRRTDVAVI